MLNLKIMFAEVAFFKSQGTEIKNSSPLEL